MKGDWIHSEEGENQESCFLGCKGQSTNMNLFARTEIYRKVQKMMFMRNSWIRFPFILSLDFNLCSLLLLTLAFAKCCLLWKKVMLCLYMFVTTLQTHCMLVSLLYDFQLTIYVKRKKRALNVYHDKPY